MVQSNENSEQQERVVPSLARWTILSVTTLSSFMAALDSNIVTIALPRISEDLSAGVSILGWVITAYILATVVFLLQAGKIGDWYGKKKIYLIGFAIFGVSSALCGISGSALELVAFRVVQGIGASFLAATSSPLVFESFPPNERGAALGINGVAWAIGAIAGPVIGGVLVSFDWRLIFYINVPIALAAILIGIKKIPSSSVRRKEGLQINLFSSVFLALTVTVVLLWLTFFNSVFAIIGVFALVVLLASEAKSKKPLLNVELRRNRGFVYSIVGLAVFQIAYVGMPFLLSLYFQSILGYTPLLTGLAIAPLPIFLAITNPIGGRLFDKLRAPAYLALFGTLVEGIAMIALAFDIGGLGSSPYYITILLAIVGASDGLIWTPIITSILKFAKPELRGVANGTAFTLANIGFAASIAISIAVSARSLPSSLVSEIYLGNLSNLTSLQVNLFNQGISAAMLVLGVINFIALPFFYLTSREQKKNALQNP